MKIRSSVGKANWSEEREEWYEEECRKMLFTHKIKMMIKENEVDFVFENGEKSMLNISKPKSQWYEIWYYLKNKGYYFD